VLVITNRPRALRSANLKLLARLLPEMYSTVCHITIANRLYMTDIICGDKREITCRGLKTTVVEGREPAANANLIGYHQP